MGEYEPGDSRNVTGTATTPDGRWTAQGQQPPSASGQMDQSQQGSQGQQGSGQMDQSSSDDSIQFQADPQLSGQMDQSSQSPGQMEQSGQSIGQDDDGVSGRSNQSNDHTSGIGQEQQLDASQSGMNEGATGQAGQTGWSTGTAAGQVRHGQTVVDSRGQHVGTVDHVDGDRIKLARKDSPDGQHHYISASQVESCEGDQVRLSCTADQLGG